jgi:hypothetical protein
MSRIAVLSLLVIACSARKPEGKAADAPAPATVVPAPDEPAPAEVVAAPEPAPAPTVVDAFLDKMHDPPPLALFAPADGTVAYTTGGSVEGTGENFSLVIETADGKQDSVWICEADPECVATAKSKRSELAAKLKDREWITIAWTEWPEKATKLEHDGFAFSWKRGKLTGTRPDGGALVFRKMSYDKPHVPSPAGVFVAKDHGIAIAIVLFDPGAGYGEGFNVYTEGYVGRAAAK